MLRLIMTGSGHIPEIHTPWQRPYKESPADRQPIANQSPTSWRPLSVHLQSIGNQSPTSHQSVPDWSPIFMESSRPPVNWSPSGQRLTGN